jgi:hypothetical protein
MKTKNLKALKTIFAISDHMMMDLTAIAALAALFVLWIKLI